MQITTESNLFFSPPVPGARSHTLRSIPRPNICICANARNAADDIDAFPLVTHARDRRHKNSRKRMGADSADSL